MSLYNQKEACDTPQVQYDTKQVSIESEPPKHVWERVTGALKAKGLHIFLSIVTIYRRVVVSKKSKKFLKRFSKEELNLIGNEIMGPNHKENIFYDFLQGCKRMGSFFKDTPSPYETHISSEAYKEFKSLYKFLQESVDTDFKKLPLLVNSPDIKKEAQAIYRARLSIGK